MSSLANFMKWANAAKVVRAQTAPVTGMVKIQAPSGNRQLAVPRKKQWLAKFPFGRISSVTAGADHTTRIQTVLECHTDWIQIGVLNGLAVDLTGVKVCVAPSTTLGADNSSASITPTGGAWVNATIGGAASGPVVAGTDLNAAKLTWFDPMNISTLDRVDGGTLPVIHVSVEIPAANANRTGWTYTTTGGWESATNTFNRPFRIRTQAGLFATSAAANSFTSTTFAGQGVPIVIRYIPRHADGLCIMVAGDSVHEGAGSSPVNHGFMHIARAAVSSPDYPVEICNMAISGATSTQYASRVDQVISTVEPDVLLMPGQTPNNAAPPTITASNIAAMGRDVGRMRAAAHSVGALPLLTTGAPWLAVAPDPTTLSEDYSTTISYLNTYMANLRAGGVPYADTEEVVRGSYDADGQAIYATGMTSDGLHLSPAGQTACAVAVRDALRRIVF